MTDNRPDAVKITAAEELESVGTYLEVRAPKSVIISLSLDQPVQETASATNRPWSVVQR